MAQSTLKTVGPRRSSSTQLTLILATLLVLSNPARARGQIDSVTQCTAHPAQFSRVDFTIMLKAKWTNSPYRSEEVRLDLDLVSPAGNTIVVPAYFDGGNSESLSVWKVRFCPVAAGIYRGDFVLTNGGLADVSKKFAFEVSASKNKGFLHIADNWTLGFDDGERFRGIGENLAWESRNRDDSRFFRNLNESPRYNYDYLVGTLAADGGNFFRTWMCPWNLPLEWKNVGNTNRYEDSGAYFNPSAIRRMDQLVDLADACDIYMMLTLDNSGDFSSWSWRNSNYNLQNGGGVSQPEDFFTNPEAKAQYKDRLRYIVARWGYSPHIGAWEFFNEIDNLMYGLPKRIPDDIITAWHLEMSRYLRQLDPYHHLITTSISHRPVTGLYDIPNMDFNQVHIYGHDGQSRDAVFPEVLRTNAIAHHKPLVIGEYGFEWDWSKNFDDMPSDMDYDFKKGLWLGLFSPTPILPMSWWWEYFDRRGTTKYIRRVRSVLDQMLTAGSGKFEDARCQWSGAPVETLAVRCGSTFFVLIINDRTQPAAGGISIPDAGVQSYDALAYEAEQNVTHDLAAPVPGSPTISGITVAPRDFLILKLTPANGALPANVNRP